MKTKDINKSLQTKLESQALGNVQIVSRKTIKDTSVKTGRKYHKHQDKNQEQARGQDKTQTSLTEQAARQDKTQASPQDPRNKAGQDIKASGQESGAKQEDRTRHKLQDRTSSKTGQAARQDKTQAGKMNGMPSSGPSSSSLSGTHSPVYGENVDYAIRIVEHFINFLPSSSGKLF